MLHFYLNFVGSKLQSIQYRVFSWPPDWGSHTTTTTIMAAPPPSRGQPHAAPRAFAAARRRRPRTNTHPGCQDSTRHAMKPALSLARHRGQHLTAKLQPQHHPARRTAESRFLPNSSTRPYKTPAAARRRSPKRRSRDATRLASNPLSPSLKREVATVAATPFPSSAGSPPAHYPSPGTKLSTSPSPGHLRLC